MSNPHEGSLVAKIRGGAAAQAKESAATAIIALSQIAEQFDMRETCTRLVAAEAQLRSDTFNLIVMGRFKNGKSTLLNALMGGTTKDITMDGHKGPMVVDDLPATATLTAVRYADEPYVKAWGFDGKAEKWSLHRYLQESALDIDDQENQKRFNHIREFEMGFPAKLCQAGVTIYDSPGLDEHETRTMVTRDATKRCDAAIVVYRSDVLMGQNELMDAARLVADGTRIFTIVNLRDRLVDDRLRGFVWNRYIHDYQGGPKWDHQDLASRDVYFVNAAMACDARYGGDDEGFGRSGLAEFEERLGEFLVRDRQHVHLRKFTTQASKLGETIEKHITQRRLAAQTDQENLRKAYADALPQLSKIRARPAKLPNIFNRYRGEAQEALNASFTQTVARIRHDLPAHLESTPLPSGEKFFKVFQQKKLQDEAAKIISSFVVGRMDKWSEEDAQSVLVRIMERLGEEIETEVAAISGQFDAINFNLTGWKVDARSNEALVGTAERVLSTVAGLFVGDFVGALTGGAGGWRGAAGSAAGAVGAGFLLTALGVTALPIILPVGIAAAFLSGNIIGGKGLEERIKDKACKHTDKILGNVPGEVEPKIANKVAEIFSALENAAIQEISAIIDEEERNIRQLVELNQRDQNDRERVLAQLIDAGTAVAKHRMALQQALTIAQQV